MQRLKHLGVRLSADEFLRVAVAAAAAAMPPSAWVRLVALSTADDAKEPATPPHASPSGAPSAKLTHTAGTRFTEEQFEALDAYARSCGLPVAAFIRQVVLGVKLRARRPEMRSAIVAINRVGNNLNQLVKLANSGVVLSPDLILAVQDVRCEIHSLRDVLLRVDAGETADPPA